jgi:hypothetical protein
VEPRVSSYTDETLRDLLTPIVVPLIRSSNPGIPVFTSHGCPYDYAGGPLTTRTDMNIFVLQIYADARVSAPTAEPVEHWFKGRSDSATPVTLELVLPEPMLHDRGALAGWLQTVVGPEPSR